MLRLKDLSHSIRVCETNDEVKRLIRTRGMLGRMGCIVIRPITAFKASSQKRRIARWSLKGSILCRRIRHVDRFRHAHRWTQTPPRPILHSTVHSNAVIPSIPFVLVVRIASWGILLCSGGREGERNGKNNRWHASARLFRECWLHFLLLAERR